MRNLGFLWRQTDRLVCAASPGATRRIVRYPDDEAGQHHSEECRADSKHPLEGPSLEHDSRSLRFLPLDEFHYDRLALGPALLYCRQAEGLFMSAAVVVIALVRSSSGAASIASARVFRQIQGPHAHLPSDAAWLAPGKTRRGDPRTRFKGTPALRGGARGPLDAFLSQETRTEFHLRQFAGRQIAPARAPGQRRMYTVGFVFEPKSPSSSRYLKLAVDSVRPFASSSRARVARFTSTILSASAHSERAEKILRGRDDRLRPSTTQGSADRSSRTDIT